jgi:hypothetical protein
MSGLKRVFTNTTTQQLSSFIGYNKTPRYIPPTAMFEVMKLEEVDDQFAESFAKINQQRRALGKAKLETKKRKKLHWFIRKLLVKVSKMRLFDNDIMYFRLGYRRKLNKNRLAVVNEVIKALALTHDMHTGLCEKTSITSLARQIGVMTYGQKRYGKYSESNLPEEDIRGKKPSISRVSRALDTLKQLKLVEVTYPMDKVTGKNLPVIIRLTEDFFKVFLVDLSDRERARFDKARKYILDGNSGGLPITDDELKHYTDKRIQELTDERQKYADLKRRRKYLLSTEATVIRELARFEVDNAYTSRQVLAMGEQAYSKLVSAEYARLIKLKRSAYDDIN